MQAKVKIILKIILLIFCGYGIAHEIFIISSYDSLFLQKSKVTVFLYFFVITMGLIYDRTMFFSDPIIKIKKSIFIFMILAFAFILCIVYLILFGDYPSHSRIHRFAPFNMVIILLLFLITSMLIFG
jgi:amino acid transporter